MSIDPATAAYPASDYIVTEPDRVPAERDRSVFAGNRVPAERDRAVLAGNRVPAERDRADLEGDRLPGERAVVGPAYVAGPDYVAAPGEAVLDPEYGVLEPGRARPIAGPVSHEIELRLQEVAARSRAARAPLGGPARRPRRRLGRARGRAEAPPAPAEVERVA